MYTSIRVYIFSQIIILLWDVMLLFHKKLKIDILNESKTFLISKVIAIAFNIFAFIIVIIYLVKDTKYSKHMVAIIIVVLLLNCANLYTFYKIEDEKIKFAYIPTGIIGIQVILMILSFGISMKSKNINIKEEKKEEEEDSSSGESEDPTYGFFSDFKKQEDDVDIKKENAKYVKNIKILSEDSSSEDLSSEDEHFRTYDEWLNTANVPTSKFKPYNENNEDNEELEELDELDELNFSN